MVKLLRRTHGINWRTIAGVALIVLSALAVVGLVRAASATSARLVATRLLVEGQQIQPGDVRTEEIPVSAVLGEYLPGTTVIEGKVVTRVIHPGELVPRASIGEVSETLATTVVLELGTPVASALKDGAIVDLWAAPSTSGSSPVAATPAGPRLIVSRARLAHRSETSASALHSGAQVEVVIARTDVATVLAAQAAGDVLSVIASSGAATS